MSWEMLRTLPATPKYTPLTKLENMYVHMYECMYVDLFYTRIHMILNVWVTQLLTQSPSLSVYSCSIMRRSCLPPLLYVYLYAWIFWWVYTMCLCILSVSIIHAYSYVYKHIKPRKPEHPSAINVATKSLLVVGNRADKIDVGIETVKNSTSKSICTYIWLLRLYGHILHV